MNTKWLIIGNSRYLDEWIDDVPAVENSVKLLKDTLENIYEDTAVIECFIDLATAEFISKIKSFLSQHDDNTIPIIYFCGHGYRKSRHLYLAAKDTIADAVENCSVEYSLITDTIKKEQINRSAIILDCCFSGTANGLSVDEGAVSPLSETDYPQIVCITSCKGVEKANITTNDGMQHAAFTYWFSNALLEGGEIGKTTYSFSDIYKRISKKLGKQVPTIQATGGFDSFGIFPVIQNRNNHYLEDIDNDSTILKVLLVKSSIAYPIKDNGDFGVPLGPWLLKSYIQRTSAKIIVDVFDERLNQIRGVSTSFADLIKDYDVVGASMCSCEVPPSLEKLRIAKNAGKITIAGGIFTYSNEQYLLKYPFVDFVIPGVGTYPLERLLTELRKRKEHSSIDEICHYVHADNFDCFGLQNVYSHSKQNNVMMWESATMPHIELDIWDEIIRLYGPYLDGKIDIYTSRGCNKTCSFCSVQRESKHNVILCDRTHIIRIIKYLYNKGIRKFSIKDEDFFIDGKSRLESILSEFIEYQDISFKVRARIDSMLDTRIPSTELVRYHIGEIQYGVESPNSELRKVVQKGIKESEAQVINLFKSHYECGIIVNASFILGLPGEDKKYYNNLTEFIKKLYEPGLTKVYLNFYTPHPIKGKIPDEMYLVTNDLKYFTHKIPVCYAKFPKANIKVRQDMIATYNSIVAISESKAYNPQIPAEIRRRMTQGNDPASNEIFWYGEDEKC